MRTIDINTSVDTIDGTPPGEAFQPPRYTTTRADEIRVGVWMQLATRQGSYRLDLADGLDFQEILDPATSDAERAANVTELILAFPGVTGITEGPVVVVDGGTVSISVTATTVDGSFTIQT